MTIIKSLRRSFSQAWIIPGLPREASRNLLDSPGLARTLPGMARDFSGTPSENPLAFPENSAILPKVPLAVPEDPRTLSENPRVLPEGLGTPLKDPTALAEGPRVPTEDPSAPANVSEAYKKAILAPLSVATGIIGPFCGKISLPKQQFLLQGNCFLQPINYNPRP